jgi:multiple sugar transport system permease protein
VFLTYPLGLGVYLAFTDTRIGQPGTWIGLENFESLWEDQVFWLSVTTRCSIPDWQRSGSSA